jgi:hypothetical protein
MGEIGFPVASPEKTKGHVGSPIQDRLVQVFEMLPGETTQIRVEEYKVVCPRRLPATKDSLTFSEVGGLDDQPDTGIYFGFQAALLSCSIRRTIIHDYDLTQSLNLVQYL